MKIRALGIGSLAWLSLTAGPVCAQSDLVPERDEYARWLATAPTSPLAAMGQAPIGAGLQVGGADGDLPLDGVAPHRVVVGPGGGRLEGPAGARIMPRGAPVRLGRYTLVVDGLRGRLVLTVFGPARTAKPPTYYDASPSLVFAGPLVPPEHRGTSRVLGMDGIEVDAAEAGSVLVPLAGGQVRLRVLRLPLPGGEESELEIFFRDETNGHGTYPAGRFVALTPAGSGRYRLDFNRARNPFCAYNAAYPCPAPWRGNTIPAPIAAGERYDGSDTAAPVERPSR